MSVGGNDLFGPDARKVQEWKKDTEEEKVRLSSRVFEEWEYREKNTEKKSLSTSVRPPRSLAHQSPLDALPSPTLDSDRRPPGQSFRNTLLTRSNLPRFRGGGGGGGGGVLVSLQVPMVRKVPLGILIAFSDDAPQLLHRPLELRSNSKHWDLQALKKLLYSRAIEEVADTASPGYYSHLFLVPKPDGSFRPIINL